MSLNDAEDEGQGPAARASASIPGKAAGLLKSLIRAVKRLLLAVIGGIGGLAVGGILALLLLHGKTVAAWEIPSMGPKVLAILLLSGAAGMMAPRFFMMFVLVPLSWLMDADSSGDGHPAGGDEVAWPGFLFHVSYLLGLVLFGVGVVFSSPWLAGAGLLGIAAFALGVFRQVRARKDRA
jgi:hypothetical protein